MLWLAGNHGSDILVGDITPINARYGWRGITALIYYETVDQVLPYRYGWRGITALIYYIA